MNFIMKFEKLNEDKIRIILTGDDLIKKDIDFHSFMSNSMASQDLFFDMLDEAEKQIGFVTKNYRIRIEALAISSGDFVITITRSLPEGVKEKTPIKKSFHVKRKSYSVKSDNLVYNFSTFDDFTYFMDFIRKSSFNFYNIAKNIILYCYKNTYYLVFCDVNNEHKDLKKLLSCITEFGSFVNCSYLLINKLKECGTVSIRNNAFKNYIFKFD